MASLGHYLKGSPKGTSEGDFLYIFLLHFIKVITEAVHRWFHFFKYRQCLITAPVIPTRIYALVHQVRVYAFGVPTTRLRVQCTPKALTNQGEVHQYIDYVVYFNTRDSYYLNKHTILYVFRARGYDLLVLLSWYRQFVIF